MKVLTINTYGGSLLLAAKAAELQVIGSYEDEGYGIEVQRENFPDIPRIPRLPWPTQDLSDVIIIAHPPCSAFSRQNNSPDKQGVEAPKFGCTRRIMRYGMENHAAAILIESVEGTLEGAREEHNKFAEEFDYDLYRFLTNSANFGVPQSRQRFWAAFINRKFSKQRTWFLYQQVHHVGVGEVLQYDEPFPTIKALYDYQKNLMLKGGMTEEQFNTITNGKTGEFGGSLAIFRRLFAQGTPAYEVQQRYLPKLFQSKTIRVLDPERPATTLMGDTVWVCKGKLLGAGDYKEIMGFPRDYKFQGKSAQKKAPFYLSQGITPPVGTWILEQTVSFIENIPLGNVTISVEPGRTVWL